MQSNNVLIMYNDVIYLGVILAIISRNKCVGVLISSQPETVFVVLHFTEKKEVFSFSFSFLFNLWQIYMSKCVKKYKLFHCVS